MNFNSTINATTIKTKVASEISPETKPFMVKQSEILYTAKLKIYAIDSWIIMAISVHFEPISFFITPIVEMQGIYKSENTKNESAEQGFKARLEVERSKLWLIALLDESAPTLLIIPIVPTMISFATIPQIRQAIAPHEPKPSGLNIGAKNKPICLKMLFSGLSLNEKSQLSKIQIIIEKLTIKDPTLNTNDFILDHNTFDILLIFGNLYGGSSIIKLVSPLFKIVFCKIKLTSIATSTLKRYSEKIIKNFCFTKNAVQMTVYSGIFALHDKYGDNIAVFILLFLSSSVLAVIVLVVEQPKPIKRVKTLFPDKPMSEK